MSENWNLGFVKKDKFAREINLRVKNICFKKGRDILKNNLHNILVCEERYKNIFENFSNISIIKEGGSPLVNKLEYLEELKFKYNKNMRKLIKYNIDLSGLPKNLSYLERSN